MHIRTLLMLSVFLSLTGMAHAQSPQGFVFQHVVRDPLGALVSDAEIGIRLTIRQVSAGGPEVYTETHAATTNANGLVSLYVGSGTTSDDFTAIDWGAAATFVEVAYDLTGGTDYASAETVPLNAVPFALFANTVGRKNGLNEAYNQGGSGAGRFIEADNGPVTISGNDGLEVSGTSPAATGSDNLVLKVADGRQTIGDEANYAVGISRQSSNTESWYLGNDNQNRAVMAVNNRDLRIGNQVGESFTTSLKMTNAGNVGIGLEGNPGARLHLQGSMRLENGTQAAGRVLTSNSVGRGTWLVFNNPNISWVSSGNNLYSNVSGNVGMGGINPDSKLRIFTDNDIDMFKIPYPVDNTVMSDQVNLGPTCCVLGQPDVWQSFTAGITGNLVRIRIDVSQGRQMRLRVRAGEGGSGTVLREQVFTSIFGPMDINISNPVPLVSGQVYTLHIYDLTTDPMFGTEVGWRSSTSDPYPFGRSSSSISGSDCYFATYMVDPSPRSMVIDGSGRFGIGEEGPGARMHVDGGDIFVNLDDIAYGVILKTTLNTCYRIRVNDSGTLFTTSVSCP